MASVDPPIQVTKDKILWLRLRQDGVHQGSPDKLADLVSCTTETNVMWGFDPSTDGWDSAGPADPDIRAIITQ